MAHNRRTFLKLAGLGAVVAALPNVAQAEEKAGDEIEKLREKEVASFTNYANGVDVNSLRKYAGFSQDTNYDAKGGRIRLHRGEINGQVVSPVNFAIAVTPGESLDGIVVVKVKHFHDNKEKGNKAAFPVGSVFGQYFDGGLLIPTDAHLFSGDERRYAVAVAGIAPSDPGVYNLFVVGQAQTGKTWAEAFAQIRSQTTHNLGKTVFGDDNDLSDLITDNVSAAHALKHGWTPTKELAAETPKGKEYHPSVLAAAPLRVVVYEPKKSF